MTGGAGRPFRSMESESLTKQHMADTGVSAAGSGPGEVPAADLLDLVLTALDDAKAEDVVSIDLSGKSAIADAMVIASGRSDRHVNAVSDRVLRALKDAGHGSVPAEGTQTCDWVLIDAGDVIVHIFRPEVRDFYNLEKMWSAPAHDDAGGEPATH